MHYAIRLPSAVLFGTLALGLGCQGPSGPEPRASSPSPSAPPASTPAPTGPRILPFEPPTVDPAAEAEAKAQAEGLREAAKDRLAALKKRYPRAAPGTWERATKAYEKQNWKDAAQGYTSYALHHSAEDQALIAIQRATLCQFALGDFEQGLRFHRDAVELFRGSLKEARLLRTLSTALLSAPHWGVKKGGELIRNRWDQGTYVDLHKVDRAEAIAALERARLVFAEQGGSAPELLKERTELQLELISAIARFSPFDPQWGSWYYPWAEAGDDEKVDEEGADERAGNPWWQQQRLARAEPRGMPVDDEGRVLFHAKPDRYDAALPDTAKIKFLFAELVTLDSSPNRDGAADALYRQAMMFRARDGVERLNRLATWWSSGVNVYQKDIEAATPWTLADDEVLGLIATHVGVFQVPPDENVLALLGRIKAECPRSTMVQRAALAAAQVHQSRQQYPRAAELYEQFIAENPKSDLIGQAQASLALLRQPEARIDAVRPQLLGAAVVLPIEHRNVSRLWGRARRMNQDRLLAEFKASWAPGRRNPGVNGYYPDNPSYYLLLQGDPKNYLRYAVGEPQDFELSVEDDRSLRPRKSEPSIPLREGGLWVIELYADAQRKQQLGVGPLMLESAAVVLKSTPQGTLAWVVDASSGAPVAGAEIEIFEYWTEWSGGQTQPDVRNSVRRVTTGRDGLASLPKEEPRGQRLLSVKNGPYLGAWYGHRYYSPGLERSSIVYLTTDRPVYRPTDTVELAIFARQTREGNYLPPTSYKQVNVQVTDPKGARVFEQALERDAFGVSRARVSLPKTAALGLYTVSASIDGTWASVQGGQFRVEEYKAPELEVTVSAGDGPAKLGATIPVSVRASYYFGGAAVGAKVHYKAYRSDSARRYTAPGPWDWLYGPGYGRCYYSYPWLGWWRWSGPLPWVWYPWWGVEPTPRKELVKEGTGVLDAQGALRFTIDTAKAKELYGDTDQLFTVEAEVTDASRRLVKGQGEVLATRSQFFVHVETDRGYYDTGATIRLDVRTLLPTQAPISTEGRFSVAKIALTADNGDTVEEEPLYSSSARTNGEGRLELRWDAQAAGQYRLSYTTKDAWGGEVSGSAVVWVWGAGFDGKRARFNHLEVWTNQRTYQVGQVARVLITSDVAGAHVLFSPKAEGGVITSPQVLALDGKTKVIDIPITEALVPNFFLEASLVAGGKMSEDVREIFVPPSAAELKVSVSPKAADNRPGAPAELEVRTYGAGGQPIAAEVSVSVFDRSVLYIQPEFAGDIRQAFWGQKRGHAAHSSSNLSRTYPAFSALTRPDLIGASALASGVVEDLVNTRDFGRSDVTTLEGQMFGKVNVALSGIGGLGFRGAGPGGGGATGAPAPAQESVGREESRRSAVGYAAGGKDSNKDQDARSSNGATSAAPEVRRNFADTAHFELVKTDSEGRATVRFKFPDNLGSWKVRAIGISGQTEVGEGTAAMTTSKRLMVRLQTPRFFRERDRVMLSANIHSRLERATEVKVRLSGSEGLLEIEGPPARTVALPAGGEVRVDYWAKVKGEGAAKVLVVAEGSGESDAKELEIPALVHGMEKLDAAVGSISAAEPEVSEKELVLNVPAERRVEQTELTLRWAPSLAGAMIDALPFLLEYPYGCTEQTTSRFVPAAITRRVLRESGVRLEDLAKRRSSANPARLGGEGESEYRARLRREEWVYDHNPVYNTALMDEMVAVGLERLRKMQHADGGWGWWSQDSSSVYTTAYVLEGLREAQAAGVAVPGEMLARGRGALMRMIEGHLSNYLEHQWISDEDAHFAYVMSGFGDKNERLNRYLLERREKLSVYGKSLAALAFKALHDEASAKLLFENASQRLQEDEENQTAWVETRAEGWWWWWNDEIESNAMFLRAMVALAPADPRAPRLVKWLLNHRRNGWYWRSTRDTAMTISAFAAYLAASKESEPSYDLEVLMDGKSLKKVHVDPSSLFTSANEVVLRGAEVTSGKHQIRFRRSGKGALYFNAYLSTFTLEEGIPPAGLELKVERKYWKLERSDRTHTVSDQRGREAIMKEAAYRKVPLAEGAELSSGDLVLVELFLESKNDYAQLAFEDPRPAGMEPVALRSGMTYGEAVANLEIRDDKVVFFLSQLNQGKLKLEYRLRAEIPGQFHALPTRGFAMYAPELKANGAEARFSIRDAD